MTVDRTKTLLSKLFIRVAMFLAGCAALAMAVSLNFDAGRDILAGLLSPDSPTAIVVSIGRLMVPAVGLWLVYRALH
jgi:hypothetical protein